VSERSPAHVALGWSIRTLRTGLGLSQEALAAQSGMHRNYLGGVERGERNPSYTNLLRLAGALGVPLSQIIEEAERSQRRR
jgi:transcriptional regulator with XRE-family HTH domain